MAYRLPAESMANNFLLFRCGQYVFEDQDSIWQIIITPTGVNIGSPADNVAVPVSKFEVSGNASIGAANARTNAAPANGLLVQGETDLQDKVVVRAAGSVLIDLARTATTPPNVGIVVSSDNGGSYINTQGLHTLDMQSNGTSRLKINTTGVVVNSTSTVKGVRTQTVTWDPASLANGASESKTVTGLTGLTVGDPCCASLSTITSGGWQISAVVADATSVVITITNQTGGTVDLASGTGRVMVTSF